MKKENFGNIKSDKLLLAQKRKYFVGQVILHDISKIINVKDQKVYYAGFKNGARTKVHHHEAGQMLIVTKGKGMLVLYKKTTQKGNKTGMKIVDKTGLQAGDMVYIPKNTLHWHGALKKSNFFHVAFNAFTAKGKESKTIWYDSDFVSYATRIP